ncbi:MAG: hypothetical protein ABW095_10785 [Candidatus Thiodiazotropha sp.]
MIIDSVTTTAHPAKQQSKDSTSSHSTRQAIDTRLKSPSVPLHQATEERLKSMPVTEDRLKQSPTKLESFVQSYPDIGAIDTDQPQPVSPGLDYYQERAEDFRRRNPGMQPPDYYMEYGDKYAHRFASLDQTDLSVDGLAWRDRTLSALQQAIEDKRAEDPEAFAELERDPEAFKAFAYATHPDAYVDSGLFDLPAQDIAVIAATPDLGDVLTRDGIDQTLETLGKIDARDVADMVMATAEQTLRDMPGAVTREAERIMDRFTHHSDWSRFPPLPSFPQVPNPFG